ncbi:penicillin-binding transpeptidase domain-containing protein [Bacillus sp. PS06]|uniref:penicillin-binding transpeptidase domain-containing protein n=1 Tax=Bacillus sp. PS06 TaxID=2764176 RepID=UPI001784617C|nr:penicillin-binding transpeptidase domain-containing protein [Bacillus sp. PS06]MBD8070565.1 penicillin-binding transpeptidase domain-containing protein [Bacillus sp. PS06]
MKRSFKGLFISFLLLTILTACKEEEPSPEAAFEEYTEKWENLKYEDMYEQLTTASKESITKEEFVERYQKIYGDIEAANIVVDYIPSEEELAPDENGEIAYEYKVSMETVAGPIEYTHKATVVQEVTEEEKQWKINWNPSMIFSVMDEGDEVKLTFTSPVRGEIVDRLERGLAINGEVYELGVVPEQVDESKLDDLASKIGLTRESIEQKLNASWVQPHYFVPLKRISLDENVFVTEVATEFEEVKVQRVPSRVYPYKEATANLVGYVTSITQEDLEKLEGQGYTSTDIIGKKGLEMVFEERLRGEKGVKIYIAKEDGEEFTLVSKPAKDGENLKLAIDIELQQVVYEQLKGEKGASAAIDPKTGETLALATSPSFDPNDFVLGISSEKWKELSENPNQPLINRVGYTYAPGSTLKPITAAIALEQQAITPEHTYEINEETWQKDSSWGNYRIKRVNNVKGPIDLRKALVYSDNIYFARVALDMGIEPFENGLKQFGFNETFPFDYPFYDSQISNDGIKNEQLLADSAYGQGEVEMNILHLAMSYTPFLNQGNLLKPSLFALENSEPEVWRESVVSATHAETILKDLVEVIEDPQGSGRAAKIEGVTLAGKTGTAELKTSSEDKDAKENGFFVAVDTEEPDLLVAMLIEDVKSGSGYVVPKVKNVFQHFLQMNE